MQDAWAIAVDVVSWACLLGGGAFCLIGAIGMLRLPDTYTRMHGAGVIDTGGTCFIFLGLALQSGLSLVTVKLILIYAFLLFTGPITTHALASAALANGLRPLEGNPKGDPPSKT